MIKLFPESRRPWSDSIASGLGLEDHRDPYERYFGLFGESEGAGGSDEDVDQDKQQGIAARNAGLSADQFDYSGTGISAPERSGTTFGVNGRSKTGSTAQDAAIGFTSAPGSGLPGANFGQLSNATAEQMSVVDNVAKQAQQKNLSAEQTQAAVRNALSGYETGSVTKSGNLTDRGKSAVSAALEQATAPAPQATAAEVLGTDIFAPQISTPQSTIRAMDVMELPGRSPVRALRMSPFRGVSSDLLATRMTAQATPDEMRQDMLSELRTRAIVGDEAAIAQLEGQARAEELGLAGSGRVDLSAPAPSFDNPQVGLVPVGIASTPQATAAGVLQSTPATDMLVGQQSSVSRPGLAGTTPDGRPITTTDFQSVYVDGRGMNVARPQMSVINTAAADPMTQLSQEQAIFGLGDNAPGAQTTVPARELSPLEQMLQDAVAASEPSTPVTPTGPMGAQAAAGTPAEGFYSDAYRELYSGVEGNIPGTTMASIGNTIQEFSPIGAIVRGVTGAPPLDLPPAEEQAAFQSGQLLGMPGAEIDPTTGAITGAQAGKGTLDMNRFGMVTYSGMPDPNYTGPFASLINPPPEDTGGADEVTAQQVNPCPEGYQLVDGVCQPVDDITTDATTGLPTAVVPPLFEPFTQATQVGQINPFVLQPYAPQGIQGLSPTGAALGRQV